MADINKSGIAERVASTSGSVLTWVFGLLVLASVLLPMTAASAHHHAATSSKVDASGEAALPGMRTFIHASFRAGVRPTRPEATPGWGKDCLPGANCVQPDWSYVSCCAVATFVSCQQGTASAFLARGPPVNA